MKPDTDREEDDSAKKRSKARERKLRWISTVARSLSRRPGSPSDSGLGPMVSSPPSAPAAPLSSAPLNAPSTTDPAPIAAGNAVTGGSSIGYGSGNADPNLPSVTAPSSNGGSSPLLQSSFNGADSSASSSSAVSTPSTAALGSNEGGPAADSASPTDSGSPLGGGDVGDALAGAQADGATAGQGLGAAQLQGDSPSSDGTPQNSTSAGPLGSGASPGPSPTPSSATGSTGSVGAFGSNVTSMASVSIPAAAPLVSAFPIGAPPAVGGVLLDKPALAGFEIHEIAVVGDELHLIVRDRLDRGPEALTLDRTLTDAIMVAARSLLLGDPIWLSIDPPARYRDTLRKGGLPPDGTPMKISYGGCRSSAMGLCLLKCDLLFKYWMNGCNNVTRKPVVVRVPGHRSYLSMLDPRTGRCGNWQRFWFVVEKVVLIISPEGTITDSRIDIRAKTETENNGGEQCPVAAAFSRQINFNSYSEQYPELAELKVCALATGIAAWLLQNQKIDAPTVLAYQPRVVDTPDTTPGIIVEGPTVVIEQTSTRTVSSKIMLFGGVDVDPKLELEAGSQTSFIPMARAMRKAGEQVWSFHTQAARYLATAIPLKPKQTEGRQPRLEICAPGMKDAQVMTRSEQSSRERDPVLVLHQRDGNVSFFRRLKSHDRWGRHAFGKVTEQSRTDEGVAIQFDPSEIIYRTWFDKYIHTTPAGPQTIFGRTGAFVTAG